MTNVVLEIDAIELSLDALTSASSSLRVIVDEVATSVVGTKSVRWIVETLSRNSPALLEIRPMQLGRAEVAEDDLLRLSDVIDSGIKSLQSSAVRPTYFSDRALEQLRILGSISSLASVKLGSREDRANITSQSIANINSILMPKMSTLGTVEGRLESITVHDKREFSIYDLITEQRIACNFGHRIDVEEISRHLEKRVAVFGEIKQRDNGTIVSVNVQSFRVMPSENELPAARDAFGILRLAGE